MSQDWLLVETLGAEPVVVAEGVHTRNLIPIGTQLRRSPHLMAIQTAISETVRAGSGLSSITPKNDCVIRTEVVQMSDGVIHGVQIWVGAVDREPPPRPLVGPLIWDLSAGTATDTAESLRVGGWDPSRQSLQGRAFVDDLPRRDLNPYEAKVLGMVIKPEPGVTICSTWDVNDYQGQPITVGFVSRSLLDVGDGGTGRVICRAMNWRSVSEGNGIQQNLLAQRILDGLAQPGMHRALVDPTHWTLLKWLDDPPPFFDWRAGIRSAKVIHPDDRDVTAAMAQQFVSGPATGVVRLADRDGSWTPVHVTVHRVDLEDGVLAGLAVLRAPTPEEVAEVERREPRPARVMPGWRRNR
ncbi:PAS domain-containing protein [Mycobacterium sp. SMC-4]|uniref:PAS domain-containing protein n=1 Tax=Mycobacterium sp. SMC-4 TaxID=2857059 RepID=UPI003CFC3FA7